MASSSRKRLRGRSPAATIPSTHSCVTSHPPSSSSCVVKRPRTSQSSDFDIIRPSTLTSNTSIESDPQKPAFTTQDDYLLSVMRQSQIGIKPWSSGIETLIWQGRKWAIYLERRGCGSELKYFGALRDHCLTRFDDGEWADDLLADLIQGWQGKLARGLAESLEDSRQRDNLVKLIDKHAIVTDNPPRPKHHSDAGAPSAPREAASDIQIQTPPRSSADPRSHSPLPDVSSPPHTVQLFPRMTATELPTSLATSENGGFYSVPYREVEHAHRRLYVSVAWHRDEDADDRAAELLDDWMDKLRSIDDVQLPFQGGHLDWSYGIIALQLNDQCGRFHMAFSEVMSKGMRYRSIPWPTRSPSVYVAHGLAHAGPTRVTPRTLFTRLAAHFPGYRIHLRCEWCKVEDGESKAWLVMFDRTPGLLRFDVEMRCANGLPLTCAFEPVTDELGECFLCHENTRHHSVHDFGAVGHEVLGIPKDHPQLMAAIAFPVADMVVLSEV